MKYLMTIAFSVFALFASAQKPSSCVHCKMDINDALFQAYGELNGKQVSFDATECMVNFLKEEKDLVNLKVTDYQTGKVIPAKTAFYLKSNKIPSPMGANISAYSTEASAKAAQKKADGMVLNWVELVKRFESSKFGSVDHSHHHHHGRADMYGPAGVMGDHVHAKGGKMLSVRYMNMAMAGNQNGTNSLSEDEVFENYMTAPQTMHMSMYMVGGMYAVSDRLTLMAMQNFVANKMQMNHRMSMGGMTMNHEFETQSTGLGDFKLSGLIGLISNQNFSMHINSGISVPLGSITNRDETPMNESAKLPYAMQLGSGSYDATIGGTARGSFNKASWGVQQLNTIRLNENSEHYKLGNQYEINMWAAYSIMKKVSSSIRLHAISINPIEGADPELMPMMAPPANTTNYDRNLIRTFLGVNAFVFKSTLLASAEFGLPVYQKTSGTFMTETMFLNAGLKVIL